MKMKIEMMPECEIAYIRRIGAYGRRNVQTMERLKAWARMNHLLNEDSIILGIPQDNPETTNPEKCRYDACLITTADQPIRDDNVSKGKISESNYAVFEIDHTAEAVQQAWHEIFQELSSHGYEMDGSKPIMERYAAKMVNNHRCEICVPIVSR